MGPEGQDRATAMAGAALLCCVLVVLSVATGYPGGSTAEEPPDLLDIVNKVMSDARMKIIKGIGFCSETAKQQKAPFRCVAAEGQCTPEMPPVDIGDRKICQGLCPPGFHRTEDDVELAICGKLANEL